MSSVATRLPLDEAVVIADELVGLLDDVCEQVTVCGSIRRLRASIGDIDLITVPRTVPLLDMFGPTDGTLNLLNFRLDELCGQQVIHQARRADGAIAGWGPRLRKFTFKGVNVQCQSAPADSLGMWVLIRTGPAAYVHAFVTPRGSRAVIRDSNGSMLAHRDGVLPAGFTVERDPDLGGFRLHRAHLFVETPTEASVYAALNIPYIEPWERR